MSSKNRLEQSIEWFQTSLSAGRLAHAYVVVGSPRGDGAEFVARALSLLYDDAASSVDPATHPDVLWVEPQKKSRIISVEQVREVRLRTAQTSFSGGWKTCVLVGADCLGASASNALLKTLEEPPGQSIFLLLTDQPEALLPTILSRCQRIVLSNEGSDLADEWLDGLMSILVAPTASGVLSSFSQAGRLSALLADIKASVEAGVRDDAGEGADNETIDARAMARYREIRGIVLRVMVLWYRDILLCLCGGDDSCFHHQGHADRIREQAADVSYAGAMRKVAAVEAMKQQLDRNLNEMSVLNTVFGVLSVD